MRGWVLGQLYLQPYALCCKNHSSCILSGMSSTAIATTQPGKNKAGRPKAYIDLQRVHDLAAQGLSINHLAAMIGISERALWSRMESDPAVRTAFDTGIAKAVYEASGLVIEKIRAGDVFCAMWFLKNRGGWRVGTTAELTINVRNAAPVPTIDMTNINSIAAECSRLLDAPDPDAVDAEFSEVPFDLAEAMR
jgi:hypothetical protein